MNYCKPCYDSTYASIAPKVMERIEQAKKEGRKIDFNETLKMVKELTKEKMNSKV